MEFSPLEYQIEETSRRLQELEGIRGRDVRHIVAPYRICPLGAHVDHQGGPVLGRTINAFSVLAFGVLSGPEVRLYSANFPESVAFTLDHKKQLPDSDWGRYARGAAWALGRRFQLWYGITGIIAGALPGGGLSSSASAGLAYLSALAWANDLRLSSTDLIELDRQLENEYLGLNNGILDQTTIVYGDQDALIYIDTRQETANPVLDPPQFGKYQFLVAYSGLSRELTATSFNNRVSDCCQAARQLGRFSGNEKAEILSDIPPEVFQAYQHKIPPDLQRRAAHFFSEIKRVKLGRIAWIEGDMKAFGALMNESCLSSIHQYECGTEPLIKLQEIVSGAPGVKGSRFSGGGYGGCVVGLVEMEAVPEAIKWIENRYGDAYPQITEKARFFIARAAGGLRIV